MHPEAEALLTKHRREIAKLCRRYGVVRLRVFGSALTTNWDRQTSDLDFLAEYGPARDTLPPLDALVGLQMDLEALLGIRVDVVDWNAARNPYFRKLATDQAAEFYAA